ncbi:unnamed protein product [Lupinus luteus]|uniref:Uncharacterized protein n=1 Tax=Lupinus luteus TaxID=3873 RepID=A0AAV1VXX7_LUPLU
MAPSRVPHFGGKSFEVGLGHAQLAYVDTHAQADISGLVLRPATCLIRPTPSPAPSAHAPCPHAQVMSYAQRQLHVPSALVKSSLDSTLDRISIDL